MLDTLRRLVLGDPSPKAKPTDPADDLTHIEAAIRETTTDLQEARAAVDQCRQKLAEVDARTLLDTEETGDDMDAEDWREQLRDAEDDVSRLSAVLPLLHAQREAAQQAQKQRELSLCRDVIDQSKRQYADLATVLSSQLSAAADTAATMAGIVDRIETQRTKATALQVEMGSPPSGISFSVVDVRVLWSQMLSKARRPAVTTSVPTPTVEPGPVVTDVVTFVAPLEARTWFESDGHRWELTDLPSPVPCVHRVGNRSMDAICAETGTRLARYLLPGGEIREWPYCQRHSEQYAAAHHLSGGA